MAAMNTVEFLRACTTNVRLKESLPELNYIHFGLRAQDESPEIISTALNELRGENVLCTRELEDLWVFGLRSDDSHRLRRSMESLTQLEKKDEGVLSTGINVKSSEGKTLDDRFLDAMEGSITYHLSQGYEMLHIGKFLWLFVPSDVHLIGEENGGVILRMHPKITDDGSLYVPITTEKTNMLPLQNRRKPWATDVTLAPYGTRASLISETNSLSTLSSRGANNNAGWKATVSISLQPEYIDISADDTWLLVSVSGHDELQDVKFLWPSRLCLAPHTAANSGSRLKSKAGWAHWFNSSTEVDGAFKDPLAAAEEWYGGAAQRALASNATLIADPPTSDTMVAASTVIAETPIATSPPFNQRLLDQQNAMAGIYPTPPDGFVPGQQHLNPTSDGLTAAMQVDAEHAADEHGLPGPDGTVGHGNSMDSARDGQPYEPHSDDLFGEMTEMDFGANEVGDADFDYFDDPDAARRVDEDIDMIGMTPAEGVGSVASAAPEQMEFHFNEEHANADLAHCAPPSNQLGTMDSTTLGEIRTEEDVPTEITKMEIESEEAAKYEPEKPLSPFGIRERLLPPPIPASVINKDVPNPETHRPSSTFDAVVFNENVSSTKLYSSTAYLTQDISSSSRPNISLPSRARKGQRKSSGDPDSLLTDGDTSSDEESYDSMTSVSEEEEAPPKMPWETKKRKKSLHQNYQHTYKEQILPEEGTSAEGEDPTNEENAQAVLGTILKAVQSDGINASDKSLSAQASAGSLDMSSASSLQDLLELDDLQLVSIAQVVCEQAMTTSRADRDGFTRVDATEDNAGPGIISSIQALAADYLAKVLPTIKHCTPTKLALVREPPPRPMANPGKAPQSGQPRMPPHRESSMHLGPDYFGLSPPYVRVRRGAETWEMLPPAMNFWTALGLGPAGFAKDITAVFVTPGNEALLDLLKSFGQDLAAVYEGCKFGKFGKDSSFYEKIDLDTRDDDSFHYQHGVVAISDPEATENFNGAVMAYAAACESLGAALGRLGLQDVDNTVVVCLVDPFEDPRAIKYLCACFWKLFSACRTSLPLQKRDQLCSDLVLQIIPISMIASPQSMVVLDSDALAALAMEIYDRCPPSSRYASSTDAGSALPILASPAIELASLPPKRIVFQLTSDPPSDLLHEGSILHLAYAVSLDKQWMTVCWIDSTGRYQMTSAACMRGKSFREVIGEVWDRTAEILAARDVVWRIFIVSDQEVEPGIQESWRKLVVSRVRKQVLHVTLLSTQDDPPVHLTPSSPSADTSNSSAATTTAQGAGFLTPPVTTPSSIPITASPDATGATTTTTPITPAATEPPGASSTADLDPDAYLVDTTDESWGMLLSPTFASPSTSATTLLAKGILFRRGAVTSSPNAATMDTPLQGIGVTLHWDIRIRPGGGGAEEPPIRQAEMTLREVLRMYRNLGVLGRVRGVSKGGEFGVKGDVRPVHVVCARKGAVGLEGYLS